MSAHLAYMVFNPLLKIFLTGYTQPVEGLTKKSPGLLKDEVGLLWARDFMLADLLTIMRTSEHPQCDKWFNLFRKTITSRPEVRDPVKAMDLAFYTQPGSVVDCEFFKQLQLRAVWRAPPHPDPAVADERERNKVEVPSYLAGLCLITELLDVFPERVVKAMEVAVANVKKTFSVPAPGGGGATKVPTFSDLKADARNVISGNNLSGDEIVVLVKFMIEFLRHPATPIYDMTPDKYHVYIHQCIQMADSEAGRGNLRGMLMPFVGVIKENVGADMWQKTEELSAKDTAEMTDQERAAQVETTNLMLDNFVMLLDKHRDKIDETLRDPDKMLTTVMQTRQGQQLQSSFTDSMRHQ